MTDFAKNFKIKPCKNVQTIIFVDKDLSTIDDFSTSIREIRQRFECSKAQYNVLFEFLFI